MPTLSNGVLIKQLPHAQGLPLPQYATPGSAGLDLASTVNCALAPGERTLIPTGLAIALLPGYEGQIRPRSGLALQYGLTVLNSPGTIDSDYRGEIKVLLINLGQEVIYLERGHRIAQLVVAAIAQVTWQETDTLPPSERPESGYGSTGR